MRIIHEREKCIGCGSCVAICPKFWVMAEDGKAKLLDSKADSKTGNRQLEVKEAECNQEAADVCPLSIIHIKK